MNRIILALVYSFYSIWYVNNGDIMLELIAAATELTEIVVHVLYATGSGELLGPVEAGRIVEIFESGDRVAWSVLNSEGYVSLFVDATSENFLFFAKSSAPGATCEEVEFTAIEGEGPIQVIVRCAKYWRLWLALFTRG